MKIQTSMTQAMHTYYRLANRKAVRKGSFLHPDVTYCAQQILVCVELDRRLAASRALLGL